MKKAKNIVLIIFILMAKAGIQFYSDSHRAKAAVKKGKRKEEAGRSSKNSSFTPAL